MLKEAAACGEPRLEQLVKVCSPWAGLHTGARERHEEEGLAETKCYGLTITPTPLFTRGTGCREVEELQMKE